MRRFSAISLAVLFPFLAGTPTASAIEGWHRSREDGLAAAKKSGRPVLVVTMWQEKV